MYLHQFDNFLFLFEIIHCLGITFGLQFKYFNKYLIEIDQFWSNFSLFIDKMHDFVSFLMKNQQFFTIFRENDRNLAKFLYFLNDFFEILMIYRHICAFSRLLYACARSLRNQQFYRNMSLFETISLDFRQF